jgi:hypothetical protein
MENKNLVIRKECGSFIDLELGKYEPYEYMGRLGTSQFPRSPGDSDDICDVCCYS